MVQDRSSGVGTLPFMPHGGSHSLNWGWGEALLTCNPEKVMAVRLTMPPPCPAPVGLGLSLSSLHAVLFRTWSPAGPRFSNKRNPNKQE